MQLVKIFLLLLAIIFAPHQIFAQNFVGNPKDNLGMFAPFGGRYFVDRETFNEAIQNAKSTNLKWDRRLLIAAHTLACGVDGVKVGAEAILETFPIISLAATSAGITHYFSRDGGGFYSGYTNEGIYQEDWGFHHSWADDNEAGFGNFTEATAGAVFGPPIYWMLTKNESPADHFPTGNSFYRFTRMLSNDSFDPQYGSRCTALSAELNIVEKELKKRNLLK